MRIGLRFAVGEAERRLEGFVVAAVLEEQRHEFLGRTGLFRAQLDDTTQAPQSVVHAELMQTLVAEAEVLGRRFLFASELFQALGQPKVDVEVVEPSIHRAPVEPGCLFERSGAVGLRAELKELHRIDELDRPVANQTAKDLDREERLRSRFGDDFLDVFRAVDRSEQPDLGRETIGFSEVAERPGRSVEDVEQQVEAILDEIPAP